MATSPLGLRTNYDEETNPMAGLTAAAPITANEAYTQGNEGQLVKSLRGALVNVRATNAADTALTQEAAGNPNFAAELAKAQAFREQGQLYTPRVGSLRDVHGLNDAIDYGLGAVGSGLGSMVPSIGGAVVGGLLGRYGRIAGAVLPSLVQERGEAALDQYNDPAQMAHSVQERDVAASRKGLANAALESVVPYGLAAGLGKRTGTSFVRELGKNALEEGATEAAQQYVGHEAQRALDPTKGDISPWELADAAAQGALGGGGATAIMQGPAHAAGAVADRVAQGAQAVQAAGGSAVDAVSPVVGQVSDAAGGVADSLMGKAGELAGSLKDRFGGDAAELASKAAETTGTAKDVVSSFLDRANEAAKTATSPSEAMDILFKRDAVDDAQTDLSDDESHLKGATPDETAANLEANDAGRVERAARFAQDLYDDPATPDRVRAQIDSYGGDYSSPEAQRAVAQTLVAQRGGQKISKAVDDIVELGKSFLPKAKEGASSILDSAKKAVSDGIDAGVDRVVKKNLQDISPAERAAYGKVVFDNLTDEAKSNPDVRSKMQEITPALIAFAARTKDITARDIPALTRMSNAMSLFNDPEQLAQQLVSAGVIDGEGSSWINKIKGIQNAQSDVKAGSATSFLVSALTPEAQRLSVAQKMQVAQLVDNFSLTDANPARGDAMVKALGTVFGGEDIAKTVLDYYAQQNRSALGTAYDANEAVESGINEAGEEKAVYKFKDAKSLRPFLKGQAIKTVGDNTLGRESQQTPTSYDQYVTESNIDPETEVGRLREDLEKRIQESSRPRAGETAGARDQQLLQLRGEKSMLDAVVGTKGALEALSNYEVLRAEGKTQNNLEASDQDLRSFAVKSQNKEGTNAANVTFVRKDGTKLMLNAESMIKGMSAKEGSGKGEGDVSRQKRLFKEAVASVLAREDMASMQTKMAGLKLDGEGKVLAEPVRNERMGQELAHAFAQPGGVNEIKAKVQKALRAALNGSEEARYTTLDQLSTRIEQSQKAMDDMVGKEGTALPLAVAREKQLIYTRAKERIQDVIKIAADVNPGVSDVNEIGNTDEVRTFDEDGNKLNEPGLQSQAKGSQASANPKTPDVRAKAFRDPTDTSGTARPRATAKELARPKAEPASAPVTKANAQNPSSMNPLNGPLKPMTTAEKQAIVDEIHRVRGPGVRVAFGRFVQIGASGEFSMDADRTKRFIKIAVDSLNPLSVAYHESMHDFFNTLGTTRAERKVKADLLEAASAPQVLRQLRELLSGHPDALKQIESDQEERLAYLYQFWTEGAIKLGPTGNGIFQRIRKFLMDALGVLGQDEKIDVLLDALHTGKLADPSIVAAAIQDLNARTLGERVRELAGPLATAADAWLSNTTDRLRSTNLGALNELADLFHREPGREESGLPFLQRRSQQGGKYLNKLQAILSNTTAAERATAVKNLQSMKGPSSPLEQKISDYLLDMYQYMDKAGVKVDGKRVGFVRDYFPRMWDPSAIRSDEKAFRDLMAQHMDPRAAKALFDALVNGDGSLELAENKHNLGFTPFMPAVKDRALTFINATNAADFVKYQNPDLADIMTMYTQRAVHRAEYARDFGNDGEVIQQLLSKAKTQGGTEEDLTMAQKAVMGLEGTLGYDMNRPLKEIQSTVMTVQNLILLPFALFSNLIDPMGVALRSNDMTEAYKAFTYGIKGIVTRMAGKTDEHEEMAKLLGLIDDQNMLDAMGATYNSMHMSKTLKKVNDKFFKYNGMEMWNQRMRVAAMLAAQRFIIKNISNTRYMNEMGIDKSDIFIRKDGKLALTEAEIAEEMAKKLVPGSKNVGKTAKDVEKRVQAAVFKFVDGAILRPNAAHRPIWGSDPRFALIFHLKQFAFSFQSVILGRVKEELRNENSKALLYLAAYVPFMIAADAMKGSFISTHNATHNVYDVVMNGVARSGIRGTGQFVDDAVADAMKGEIPGTSFMGPTFDHISTILKGLGGHASAQEVVNRSVPFAKYF